MPDTADFRHDPLLQSLAHEGFVFAPSHWMRSALVEFGGCADWEVFSASWNQLEVDTYMADQGRYRRRRHAVYAINAEGVISRSAHQPHYQSREYNALNGGVERWFEPVDTAIGASRTLSAVLQFCRHVFGALTPARRWHVEVHQFRIEARAGVAGFPTPEGVHRDGVDHVLVLLITRCNIERGTTTIHSPDGTLLGSFTLTAAGDAALVDDTRVCHGVTAVDAIDTARAAYRDVLVVTFKAVQ